MTNEQEIDVAAESVLGRDAAPRPGSSRARVRRGLPARDRPVGPDGGTAAPDPAALDVARRAVDLAADKKAADIVLLEVGGLTTIADYFVICSATSERQLGAVADGIVQGLREAGVRPVGREGSATAHWLLLDFGSVIVHVMAPPERDYYQLERLWAEAPLLVRVQ